MIDKFIDWYVGSFTNRKQALSHPFMFKEVRLTHKYMGDNTFYGEQKTVYTDNTYRKFKNVISESDGLIIAKNYTLEDKYMPNCDMVFKFDGEQFVGEVEGCDCFVEREGKQTYVKNSTYLSEDSYKVYDRGYEVDTDEYVWGSRWGHFKFIRIDKEPIWIEG